MVTGFLLNPNFFFFLLMCQVALGTLTDTYQTLSDISLCCIALLSQLFNWYCFNNGLPLSLCSSSLTRQDKYIDFVCAALAGFFTRQPWQKCANKVICSWAQQQLRGWAGGAHKQHAREAATVNTDSQNSNDFSNN